MKFMWFDHVEASHDPLWDEDSSGLPTYLPGHRRCRQINAQCHIAKLLRLPMRMSCVPRMCRRKRVESCGTDLIFVIGTITMIRQ